MGTKKVGASAGPLAKADLILTQELEDDNEIFAAWPAAAASSSAGILGPESS